MEKLHQLAAGADEDEHVAVAYVAFHLLMYHTTKRTDTLTQLKIANNIANFLIIKQLFSEYFHRTHVGILFTVKRFETY
jgi:hypothetical protein